MKITMAAVFGFWAVLAEASFAAPLSGGGRSDLINGCPDTADPTQTAAFYTSDPGKALITGKCSDVYRVKVPILRGLAARAPYFHNGAASDLSQVVNFYDQPFQMGLTPEQKSDLVAFLAAL